MGPGEAAERVGWGHTLDSAVKEGLSEEVTQVEELVLWGNGKERFRSGYGKYKGPEVERQGPAMAAIQHQQGAWILLSALGSRDNMRSDDLLLRLVREALRVDCVCYSSLVPLNLS